MDRFAQELLKWFANHGRKDLPWQHPINAYRVWVSEIMLQQTQVKTVIPYFNRFIKAFPDIKVLADAPLDTVLHYWSGLGFYRRAHFLHQAAKQIHSQYHGKFPTTLHDWLAIPGVGRSTAAAIMSIVYEQPTAILDGNVKRVLSRYHAIDGKPNAATTINTLWQYADDHMPRTQCRQYTQAIMDLGATVCTRRHPDCNRCPVKSSCKAYQSGDPSQYPASKMTQPLPEQTQDFLAIQSGSFILLQQRDNQGIWPGLWSFPLCEVNAQQYFFTTWLPGTPYTVHKHSEKIRHTFSHYHLNMRITQVALKPSSQSMPPVALATPSMLWYNMEIQQPSLGIAAPICAWITRKHPTHKA